MVNFNDTIHIYKNDEYPHGYTIAKNRSEADGLAVELVHRMICDGVSVVAGMKHWKTGKPAYYVVYFDAPYEVKPQYKVITSLV